MRNALSWSHSLLATHQERADHGREESHKLLQEELTRMKERPQERKEVVKVYQAMVVLQARQVLASLLAGWPESGPRLSTSSLGSIDPTQYFCLLDLLLKQQSPCQAEKVRTVCEWQAVIICRLLSDPVSSHPLW